MWKAAFSFLSVGFSFHLQSSLSISLSHLSSLLPLFCSLCVSRFITSKNSQRTALQVFYLVLFSSSKLRIRGSAEVNSSGTARIFFVSLDKFFFFPFFGLLVVFSCYWLLILQQIEKKLWTLILGVLVHHLPLGLINLFFNLDLVCPFAQNNICSFSIFIYGFLYLSFWFVWT